MLTTTLTAGGDCTGQRHIKRHGLAVLKRREDLEKAKSNQAGVENIASQKEGESDKEKKKTDATVKNERVELQSLEPFQSALGWSKESPFPPSGGAVRHKNRKLMVNQAARHLSVELHNEGLWITVVSPPKPSQETGLHPEFLVWGNEAYSCLASILCGEIPRKFQHLNFGEAAAALGGQFRCIVADLRVSDETASEQRAHAVREYEDANMAELEKRVAAYGAKTEEDEKAVKRCMSDERACVSAVETASKKVSDAKGTMAQFRTKFQRYLGPGKRI